LLAVLAAALLPFGSLYVNSLPSGADVWVDGSYIGRTPLLVDGLRSGKHSLTITKAGWKVQEIDEQVTAGIMTPATVQLEAIKALRQTGELVVNGAERAAKVSIDGGAWQPLAATYSLTAGAHRIAVRDSKAKYERMAAIYPGQVTHVLVGAPAEEHAAVVAPLGDYLPLSAAKLSDGRLVVRWGGHTVVGHVGDSRFLVDGRDVVYDAPAGMVRGRLYLPLELIRSITGSKSK
jgi:hypothetical protein